jgi:hypothetical protein
MPFTFIPPLFSILKNMSATALIVGRCRQILNIFSNENAGEISHTFSGIFLIDFGFIFILFLFP